MGTCLCLARSLIIWWVIILKTARCVGEQISNSASLWEEAKIHFIWDRNQWVWSKKSALKSVLFRSRMLCPPDFKDRYSLWQPGKVALQRLLFHTARSPVVMWEAQISWSVNTLLATDVLGIQVKNSHKDKVTCHFSQDFPSEDSFHQKNIKIYLEATLSSCTLNPLTVLCLDRKFFKGGCYQLSTWDLQ